MFHPPKRERERERESLKHAVVPRKDTVRAAEYIVNAGAGGAPSSSMFGSGAVLRRKSKLTPLSLPGPPQGVWVFSSHFVTTSSADCLSPQPWIKLFGKPEKWPRNRTKKMRKSPMKVRPVHVSFRPAWNSPVTRTSSES